MLKEGNKMKRTKMAKEKIFVVLLSALVLLTAIQFSPTAESPPKRYGGGGPVNFVYYGYIHDINESEIIELANYNITIKIISDEGDEQYNLTSDSYGFYNKSFTWDRFITHIVNYTIERYVDSSNTTIVGYFEFYQTQAADRRVDPTFIQIDNIWEWFYESNPPPYDPSPHPDLEVVDIRFSNDNPNEGDNITIYADIKNCGEEAIGTDDLITVSFYNDSNLIQENTIGGLNQGQTKIINVSWTSLVAGYHIITVKVDLCKTYLEIREEWNNIRNENIDVWKWISGDWNVTMSVNYSSIPFVVDGNLNVKSYGNLTLNNSKLKIKSSNEGQHKIEVMSGGELNLILTEVTAYDTCYRYGFEIYDLTKIEWSNISYMHNGIEIYNANLSIFGSNIFNSNGPGISIHNVSDPTIIYNNIYSNSADGILFNHSFTSNSDNITIGLNYIYANGGAGMYLSNGSNLTFARDIIDQNYIGIRSDNSKIECRDYIISNSSSYSLKLSGDSQMVTFNATFNKSSVNISDESQLKVKWLLIINVKNANGYRIRSPTVIITNNYDNETFNGTANMQGQIPGIYLLEYIENVSTKTYYSPYNITAYKHGNFTGITSSMTNKSKEETVIIPGPDLIPFNMTLFSNITLGNPTNITANIKNIGNTTVNNISIRFYVGKTPFGESDSIMNKTGLNYSLLGNDIISSLSSDSGDNVSIVWSNPIEGMRNIKIEIDYNLSIPEIDEYNNYLCRDVYVDSYNSKPFPIYGYVYTSDGITPVENASVTIENQATGENLTYETDYLGRYIENLLNMPNGFNNGDTIIITANYGDNYTVNETIIVNTTLGLNQTDLKFADLNLTLPEPGNATIDSGSNLRIENILFSNYNLLRNNTVYIIATVFNNGSVNVTNISVRFYVGNNTQIGQDQLINISSGKYVNVRVLWIPSEPTPEDKGIVIGAKVDPDDNLTETNETDNSLGVVKMVRDILTNDLKAGVNKVIPDNFTHNFTASAIDTGLWGGLKYITKKNSETGEYYTYVRGFSNKEASQSPFVDNSSGTLVVWPNLSDWEFEGNPDVPNSWKWSSDFNGDGIDDSIIKLSNEAASLMEETTDDVSADGLWHCEGNPLDANTWEIIDAQGDIWEYKITVPKVEIVPVDQDFNPPEVQDYDDISWAVDDQIQTMGILQDMYNFIIEAADSIEIDIDANFMNLHGWCVFYGLKHSRDKDMDDGLIIYQARYLGNLILGEEGYHSAYDGVGGCTPWIQLDNGIKDQLTKDNLVGEPTVYTLTDGFQILTVYKTIRSDDLRNIEIAIRWSFGRYEIGTSFESPVKYEDGYITASAVVSVENPANKYDLTMVVPFLINPSLKVWPPSDDSEYMHVEYYTNEIGDIGFSPGAIWYYPQTETKISCKEPYDKLYPAERNPYVPIVKMKFYSEDCSKGIYIGPHTSSDAEDYQHYYALRSHPLMGEHEKHPNECKNPPEKVQGTGDIFWYEGEKTIKKASPSNGYGSFDVDLWLRELPVP